MIMPIQGIALFLNRDPIEEAGGINLYGFCGNDAINGFDVMGNGNFFQDAWDDTIGAVGKGIGHAVSSLQRWTNAHPIVGNLLDIAGDLLFPGVVWPLDLTTDLTDAHVVWSAAQRNPQIAGVVAAIASWYIGGALGLAIDPALTATEETVIAGASAGFGGGFVSARASGASLSQGPIQGVTSMLATKGASNPGRLAGV
jgi:hypothetical protein